MMWYIDTNRIGNQGCMHLVRAHWPSLKEIRLGKSDINEGYNNISQ